VHRRALSLFTQDIAVTLQCTSLSFTARHLFSFS